MYIPTYIYKVVSMVIIQMLLLHVLLLLLLLLPAAINKAPMTQTERTAEVSITHTEDRRAPTMAMDRGLNLFDSRWTNGPRDSNTEE